jgi:hypothetical protein
MRHVFSTCPRRCLGKFFTLTTVALAAWSTGCGDESAPPAAPSSTVVTTPATPATPAPTSATLARLTIAPGSVDGQSHPEGTVSLAAAAPAGGARITLLSSNTAVARVPATITIPSGATQDTFTIDTSTVTEPQPVTISASYSGVTLQAALTVTGPTLVSVFTVRSPLKGNGACVMGPTTEELDCTLDGRESRGFIDTWAWTYSVANNRLSHTSKDGDSRPKIVTKCAFFEGGRGGDDAQGNKYVQMMVELQVQDRAGTRSAAVRQAVRLYPNRQCGFSY